MLHEAGHYVAAKATGMRVERFFLFFGPTTGRLKRGETEYGVKSIPVGGYVKITGMNPEEELPPEHEHRAYYRQAIWKRIVVVAAGPGGQHRPRLRDPLLRLPQRRGEQTQTVGEIGPGCRPRRRCSRATGSSRSTATPTASLDRTARLERFGNQVASHECAGKQVDGCRAATPVRCGSAATARCGRSPSCPEYDRANKRTLIGFSYGGPSAT